MTCSSTLSLSCEATPTLGGTELLQTCKGVPALPLSSALFEPPEPSCTAGLQQDHDSWQYAGRQPPLCAEPWGVVQGRRVTHVAAGAEHCLAATAEGGRLWLGLGEVRQHRGQRQAGQVRHTGHGGPAVLWDSKSWALAQGSELSCCLGDWEAVNLRLHGESVGRAFTGCRQGMKPWPVPDRHLPQDLLQGPHRSSARPPAPAQSRATNPPHASAAWPLLQALCARPTATQGSLPGLCHQT